MNRSNHLQILKSELEALIQTLLNHEQSLSAINDSNTISIQVDYTNARILLEKASDKLEEEINRN